MPVIRMAARKSKPRQEESENRARVTGSSLGDPSEVKNCGGDRTAGRKAVENYEVMFKE